MTGQEIAGLVAFGLILLFFAVGYGLCATFFLASLFGEGKSKKGRRKP